MNKHLTKMIIALVFCGLAATMAFADEPAKTVTAQEAFAMLKGLAGEWQGKAMDKEKGPEVSVTYRVTANGSVVLETLFPGSAHEMLTLYHLDNGKLVLTHYCAMGNQPRMELDPGSSARAPRLFLRRRLQPRPGQGRAHAPGPHRPGRPGPPGKRVGCLPRDREDRHQEIFPGAKKIAAKRNRSL